MRDVYICIYIYIHTYVHIGLVLTTRIGCKRAVNLLVYAAFSYYHKDSVQESRQPPSICSLQLLVCAPLTY